MFLQKAMQWPMRKKMTLQLYCPVVLNLIMLNSFSLVVHLHTLTFPHLPQADFPLSPHSRAQRSEPSFASLSAVMARKFVFRINLSMSKIYKALFWALPFFREWSQRARMSTCAIFLDGCQQAKGEMRKQRTRIFELFSLIESKGFAV